MATTPSADIVTKLVAIGPWTQAKDIFEGPERAANAATVSGHVAVPHLCCFVLATGGPAPIPYAGGTVNLRYSSVQIILRSNPHAFAAAQVLARTIRDSLHNASISGYLEVRAMQAEPVYLGEDENADHSWSINIEMIHEQ